MNKIWQFVAQGLFIFFASLFLASCGSPMQQPVDPEVIRSTKIVDLSQKLESMGARVIQTGQTLQIILPSDELFALHSANFTDFSSTMLDVVSRLMAILETTSAQVAAYTDAEPDALRSKALATRQAEVVADYLWSKGLDTRMLYSVGYSSINHVNADLPGSLGIGANRRVEIKFQYLSL